jgi:hypothetical protein
VGSRRWELWACWALPLIYCYARWLSCCSRLFKGSDSVVGVFFLSWWPWYRTSSVLEPNTSPTLGWASLMSDGLMPPSHGERAGALFGMRAGRWFWCS